jgi:AAA15 family ATPase/GTPase
LQKLSKMEVFNMLLEFRTKNYKSFKDELVFSMIPAPKQKGLDYSVLHEKIASKKFKALCSAVIYGPNAAGKSNIIGAMEVLQSIVLRGNIRDDDKRSAPNTAVNNLELIPNQSYKVTEPVHFSIKFMEEGMLFDYQLVLDLGLFLEDEYKRKVLSEKLFINEYMIFSRENGLEFENLKVIGRYLNNEFENNANSAMSLAKGNLNSEELFLVNGFKAMFSSKLVSIISDWMENKFMVIYRADSIQLIRRFSDPKKKTVYVEKTTNEAAKLFGINSNDLGYVVHDEESEAKLYSLFNGRQSLPAEIFESHGTVRFVNIFPLVINALLNGGTLIVDEFESALHPMALMSIVNLFHNNDLNKKNAQLIFNTHNPIFLNANLFRRDEIKFVERDENTHDSIHYSLSDFGTSGENAVRIHGDYMKNYFIGRYGAITDIDFTSIFEEVLKEREEV